MQKIIPSLWCVGNAREMAEFYIDIFPDSKITGGSKYPETKNEGLADFQKDFAGKDLTVEISLMDFKLTLVNAGPEFTPNPSTSFMAVFTDSNVLKEAHAALSEGGHDIMPLEKYPFCELYGWVQDKYGYSWQLVLGEEGEVQRMYPALSFAGDVHGKASEAAEFYMEVFPKSEMVFEFKNEKNPELMKICEIQLEGQSFALDDDELGHGETFTPAVSFQVFCKDQEEIDQYWERLSVVPEAEQCGWCADKYGVSWQIIPQNIEELMSKPDAFKTMMSQKKIIISEY